MVGFREAGQVPDQFLFLVIAGEYLKQYKLTNLEEDLIWTSDFRPYFNLSSNVLNIVTHGFTEMVNNAIDHSAGTSIFISASLLENSFTLAVSDNGIGIFEKISKALNLVDKRQALFELSKGKFTTDPKRHSGEGQFFTSRMFDFFEIDANGLQFSHDDTAKRDWLLEEPSPFKKGRLFSCAYPWKASAPRLKFLINS
jgi:anti-sigma regulatory factor (Ser/Thr protein kinase)